MIYVNKEHWGQKLQIEIPAYDEIEKDVFNCIVVEGKDLDLIFQFFSVKCEDFEETIAEVIEDHFGNTEDFAIEFVTELDMFGLLAKNIKDNPLFSKEFHVHAFLDLLAKTITELQE